MQDTHTYLRASPRAIHDRVTTIERKRVLQLRQALLCVVVSGIDHPAIGLKIKGRGHRKMLSQGGVITGGFKSNTELQNSGPYVVLSHLQIFVVISPGAPIGIWPYLHQHSRTQVLVPVPPVTGATGAAAGAQDALVESVLVGQNSQDAAETHDKACFLKRGFTRACASLTACPSSDSKNLTLKQFL